MSDEPENVNPPPDDTEETPALADAPRPADEAVAAALADLAPAPPKLDRDRLMFEAGATSRAGTIRLWQATAGFLAAVGFAAGMAVKPPSIIERVVYVESPSEPHPANPVPSAPASVPEEPPTIEPESVPDPNSPFAVSSESSEAVQWIQVRNDVLAVGTGAIPDSGRQPPPSPNMGLNQPGLLPRGMIFIPK